LKLSPAETKKGNRVSSACRMRRVYTALTQNPKTPGGKKLWFIRNRLPLAGNRFWRGQDECSLSIRTKHYINSSQVVRRARKRS